MATRVPIRYGGTGANTAAGVRAALGVLSTSGGSFTGNLNVNSVIMANSRGVFGNSFQDHANSVGIDTSTVIVGAYANNDGPAEVMVVNKSNGSVAYAEFIALNDTANQEQGWISIGVNSSDYNDPEYTLTGPDDGYLLFEAPLGTAANGDLIIGTGSYGDKNRIVLAAGGFEPSDAQLLIAPANLKSASITQSRLNSNIAILTTSATHNFVANDVVIISSVGAPYDGTRTILAVTANTFNVSITSANVALANVSPAGEALEYLPFNKGTVELTAQLFVGENSKSTIETADITLAEGHAIPLGIVVNNDGPGQTVMFNKSNGALAFSEFIAHNDQGNVHQGWISMGINSSGYDDPEFPITKEDDGYLLFEAPAGTTGGGDLIIGTGTNGQTNRLIFAAEGFDEANAQMIITPDESVRISINTDSSSANTGALQIVGGVGVQGSMYVQGNQTIQGDLIVNGSQIIQSIENLAAAGPISLVSEGNIANTWDQGIVGTYAVAVGSVARNVAFKEIANNTGIISTSNNHSFIVEDIVTIAGVDATFNGTHRITAVTANTLSFYLLAGNVSKTSSSGTATVDKTTKYTGLVKKASDGTWRIFSNLGSRPGFNTDLSAANLAYDSIIAGSGDFRGTLKLGSPNTATISYTDNNARALTIPALSGDRTFAFIDQAQTFTAAQGFNSTVTATKFIPTGGDATGNGLYLPSANRVSISADGVERVAISATETVVNDGSADYDFRVESDGVAHMLFVDGGTNTVGIGTNAPSANLHVVGTGYISGDVGIGTTIPLAKLDVLDGGRIRFRTSTGAESVLLFQNSDTGTGSLDGLYIGIDGSEAGYLWNYENNFLAFGTNNTERARFTSGGDLLVGTTSTGASGIALPTSYNYSFAEGSGNSYANLYRQLNSAATVLASGYKRSNTAGFASSFGTSMARAAIAVGYNNGSIAFFSDTATNVANGTDITPTERLTINNAGNVGIGTANPVARLHVEGPATTGTIGVEDVLILGRALSGGVSFQQSAIFKLGRYAAPGGIFESFTRLDIALKNNAATSDYTTTNTIMTLLNSGSVGIGTTNPGYRLDVTGAIRSTNEVYSTRNAGNTGFISLTSGSGSNMLPMLNGISENNGLVGFYFIVNKSANQSAVTGYTAGAFRFTTDFNQTSGLLFAVDNNYSNRFAIDYNGNVGIGTTSPSYRLHVNGTSYFSGNVQGAAFHAGGRDAPYTSISETSSGAMSVFGHNARANTSSLNYITAPNSGYHSHFIRMYYDHGIAFHTSTGTRTAGNVLYDFETPANVVSGTAERMRIDTGGNVGIGTANPLGRLHVYGGDTVLYSGSVGNSPKLIFGNETSSTDKSIYLDNFWLTFKGHNNEGFKFITVNSSGTPTERFRVQGDGSTLLGAVTSTTADGLFTIKNYVAANINISLRDNNNQRRCIFIADGYYGYQWGQTIHGDGGKAFSFGNAAGTEVGTIVVNNASTAYNTTSDYRLKENQAPLTGSGAFIDALQPKTWTWKSNGERGVGFIAHEVAAVSPASVTGEKDATRLDLVKDEDGNYVEQTIPSYQALEYGSPEFIANIIAELQSLRARVAALENK